MTKNEIIIPELNSKTIESMIYEIRSQKVMLDFDLAKIYGYTTKAFNQQVNRNIDRFDGDFMFQITRKELDEILMSQNVTSSWGGIRKLPYAFTEQGIYMLMTVLKGELAIKQSKIIIKLFKQMKDYIVENNDLVSTYELLKLTNKVTDLESNRYRTDKSIEKLNKDNKIIKKQLEIVMDNFIDPTKYKHYLILDGERIEAIVAYQEIYKLAKKSIYIIDDYIDIKTLQLLKVCNSNIEIIIFTDNKAKNNITLNYIKDFIKDTGINISFKKNNSKSHDRYIIIDYKEENEIIYHCGSSSKDSGNRITTISKIEFIDAYNLILNDILNNDILTIE